MGVYLCWYTPCCCWMSMVKCRLGFLWTRTISNSVFGKTLCKNSQTLIIMIWKQSIIRKTIIMVIIHFSFGLIVQFTSLFCYWSIFCLLPYTLWDINLIQTAQILWRDLSLPLTQQKKIVPISAGYTTKPQISSWNHQPNYSWWSSPAPPSTEYLLKASAPSRSERSNKMTHKLYLSR